MTNTGSIMTVAIVQCEFSEHASKPFFQEAFVDGHELSNKCLQVKDGFVSQL